MLTSILADARKRLLIALATIGAIIAGAPSIVLGQGYTQVREQGFGPLLNESSSVIPPNRPATGAVNVLLSSPRPPGALYAGGVSGGVWKTLNGFSPSPHWIPLTDKFLPQLSVSSLASSPVNPDFLFAGTGSTSSADSFNSVGLGIGMARSLDGGRSWQLFAKETFIGRAINSIVPTSLDSGKVILAATWLDGMGQDNGGGVYRSSDMGSSFVRISGASSSGLPDAGVSSLIGDPRHPSVLYAAVPQTCNPSEPNCNTQDAGIYRSEDGGLRWVKIDRSPLSEKLRDARRILLTIHSSLSNNIVFVDVINWKGGLGGVFRTPNKGSDWESLAPLPPIYHSKGVKESNVAGSGNLHAAFAADPARPGVVVIGGNEEDPDNAEGCRADNTIVYRFDPGIKKWESVVCKGAHDTAPHADSRFLTFAPNGDLLFTGDGGPNRLLNPANAASRRWVSLAGNLRTAEIRSIAFDPLSNVLIGGAQDNGASYQLRPGGSTWCQLLGGDGGVVAVDADQNKHPGTSFRFMSSQDLEEFTKTTWDRSNRLLSATRVGQKIVSGPGEGKTLQKFDQADLEFSQPYELNAVDPGRMVIRTSYLYESLDAGDTLANLGCFTAAGLDVSVKCPAALVTGNQAGYGRPIAYGGRLNGEALPDVFYIGAGDKIFHRTAAAGPTTILASYVSAHLNLRNHFL